MINILVAENSHELQEKLHSCLPEGNVITAVNNSTCMVDALNNLKPDFAFLDLQTNGPSTISELKKSNHQCDTVFTSNSTTHYEKSFQAGAIDYLLKPYSEHRLQECIARLTARLVSIKREESPSHNQKNSLLKYISIQQGNKIWVVNVKDIISFRAYGRFVKVQTKDREGLLRLTLKHLIAQLNPDNFWQIHRSTVINIEHLNHVQIPNSEQMLAQMNHIVKPHVVSRSFIHLFKAV